jgi:hypothetical protein
MSQPLPNQAETDRYREIVADPEFTASQAALALFKEYARERPEVVALWTFGLGVVIGWKLKPW